MNILRKIDKKVPILIDKLGHFLNPLILNFKKETNRLMIFYFHGVYESTSQKELNHIDPQNNITVQQFSEFIDYFLHHKYVFINPEGLEKNIHKEGSYVMITFDDGYFNNTLAIEVLNKYQIPATFFVTTRNVIENKSFWWDIIYKYRTQENANLTTIRKEQSFLKDYKYNYIESYIKENFGNMADKPWSDIDRPFSIQELKHIAQNPLVSIGNHTHNHTILTKYSEEEIRTEFSTSNKLLSDITGSAPISVAFPNGDFNNLILNIAEEIGFRYAFTTQNQINLLPQPDQKMMHLNRFMAKTTNIETYGSFNRLNYDPNMLYLNIKKQLAFSRKR